MSAFSYNNDMVLRIAHIISSTVLIISKCSARSGTIGVEQKTRIYKIKNKYENLIQRKYMV